ncbi:uncharacterized protein LOC144446751 [Glandiceps talaboti]
MMNRCIVASGIPKNTTIKQLKNYFQEKQNGGGEVTNVVYPLDLDEVDTAVVTFANEETTQSVVMKRQMMSGHVIEVRPLLPKLKTYEVKATRELPKACLRSPSPKQPARSVDGGENKEPLMQEISCKTATTTQQQRPAKCTARMSTGGKVRKPRLLIRITSDAIPKTSPKQGEKLPHKKRTARMSTGGIPRQQQIALKHRKRRSRNTCS